MAATDNNPEVVTGDAVPMHVQHRPTFHVSREMVCFLGGIGVALGVMWLLAQINSSKKGRD